MPREPRSSSASWAWLSTTAQTSRARGVRPTPRTPWRAIRTARLSQRVDGRVRDGMQPDGACAAVGTGPPATSSSSSVPVSSEAPEEAPGGRVDAVGVDHGDDVRPPGVDGEVHQALARGLTPAGGDLTVQRQGDQIVLGHLVVGQRLRRYVDELAVTRAHVACACAGDEAEPWSISRGCGQGLRRGSDTTAMVSS